jgi:hypothetical protein
LGQKDVKYLDSFQDLGLGKGCLGPAREARTTLLWIEGTNYEIVVILGSGSKQLLEVKINTKRRNHCGLDVGRKQEGLWERLGRLCTVQRLLVSGSSTTGKCFDSIVRTRADLRSFAVLRSSMFLCFFDIDPSFPSCLHCPWTTENRRIITAK